MPATEACETVLGGPAGTGAPEVELSQLHASVRLFGLTADRTLTDQALVDAVNGDTWDPIAALDTYGPGVGGCTLDAAAAPVGIARVELGGDVAIIHPGTGPVEIPEGATALVLDLRELPAGPETAAAIEGALAAMVAGELPLGDTKLRVFAGFPGVLSGSVYSANIDRVAWTVTGTASASRPIAVLTGKALAPEAARVAGALRLARAAWLVGHPVWAVTAESTWGAVGSRGVSWPSRTLVADGAWPDLVPADVLTDAPEASIGDLASWGDPPALEDGASEPDNLERWVLESDTPLTDLDRGSARAMLLVAHGLVDRFYPYFDEVGAHHDQALIDGLTEVDTLAEGDREGSFESPTFGVITWTGPDARGWDETVYALEGTGAYTGPTVLLVSNKTVSAAENFSMMLWDAEHITVMGQQSAGTNGNITSEYLPGGFYMYFTGMEVLNPDGSGLHGVGIPLDEEVVPSALAYASGQDPELEAAIASLR